MEFVNKLRLENIQSDAINVFQKIPEENRRVRRALEPDNKWFYKYLKSSKLKKYSHKTSERGGNPRLESRRGPIPRETSNVQVCWTDVILKDER